MNRFLLLFILSFVTVLSACATDAVSDEGKCFENFSYYQPAVRLGEAGRVVSSRREVVCSAEKKIVTPKTTLVDGSRPTAFCMGSDEVVSTWEEPFPLPHRDVDQVVQSLVHRFAWRPSYMTIVDSRADGAEIEFLGSISQASGLDVEYSSDEIDKPYLGRVQIYYEDSRNSKEELKKFSNSLDAALADHFPYGLMSTNDVVDSYIKPHFKSYTYENYSLYVTVFLNSGPDWLEQVSREGAPENGVILARTTPEEILGSACGIQYKDERSRVSAISECAYRSLGLWFDLRHIENVSERGRYGDLEHQFGASRAPNPSLSKVVGGALTPSEYVCVASKYQGLGPLKKFHFLTREK